MVESEHQNRSGYHAYQVSSVYLVHLAMSAQDDLQYGSLTTTVASLTACPFAGW